MDRDTLYMLVTEAILRADTLEDLGAPGASAAHLDVSLLEERISGLFRASEAEGALARRGAVRAAVAGGDMDRARKLIDQFSGEPSVSRAFVSDLEDLLGPRNGPEHTGGAMDGAAPDASLVANVVLLHVDEGVLASTAWAVGDLGLQYRVSPAVGRALAS